MRHDQIWHHGVLIKLMLMTEKKPLNGVIP